MPGQRQPQVDQGLASRGVYVHPYVGKDGEEFAVAVDHRGRLRVEARIMLPGDRDCVIELLWSTLDRIDPPHLRLVT